MPSLFQKPFVLRHVDSKNRKYTDDELKGMIRLLYDLCKRPLTGKDFEDAFNNEELKYNNKRFPRPFTFGQRLGKEFKSLAEACREAEVDFVPRVTRSTSQ